MEHIQEIKLTDFISIKKSKDKIIIIRNWKNKAQGFLIFFLLIIPILISLGFSVIIKFDLIQNFIFLLIFIIIVFLFFNYLRGYLRYRNMITELIFDKSKEKGIYRKISPNFKILKEFTLSDIMYFTVRDQKRHGDPSLSFKGLQIIFKSTIKTFEVMVDCERDCLKLGEILAHFLKKSLYLYKNKIISYD